VIPASGELQPTIRIDPNMQIKKETMDTYVNEKMKRTRKKPWDNYVNEKNIKSLWESSN